VGAVVDMQAAVDGLCARPRLGRCRDCTAVGGLSGHEPRDSRDLGAKCDVVFEAGIAGHSVVWALIVGTASEHSGR